MKTRQEVIARALKRLRVLAMDETATAEQEALAGEALDALVLELTLTHGIVGLDADSVPDEQFLPLAYVLAAEVAPDFARQLPESKARAVVRLRSVTNPLDIAEDTPARYY